uniref:Uncharacterized protein n=1 Tax=Opuntia streptacantha TaxID=393608 RepID=A0A7C9E5I2_OPUST
MVSLTDSSSDLTASFIATSRFASRPNCNRTRTFKLPMNTPESRHVCDRELLGTTSVPSQGCMPRRLITAVTASAKLSLGPRPYSSTFSKSGPIVSQAFLKFDAPTFNM